MDKQTIKQIRAWVTEGAALEVELSYAVRSKQNSHERTFTDERLRDWCVLWEDNGEGWIAQLLEYYDANEAKDAAK